MVFAWFFDVFLGFFKLHLKILILLKYVFSLRKTPTFMILRLQKSMIFSCFYNLFWALILEHIFHRFWKPFWLIFQTFWHHFSILFRHWFLVEFLMSFLSDFGRKSIDRKESGGSLLAHFFPYFSRPWFWHRFLMDFWWFLFDLGSILARF